LRLTFSDGGLEVCWDVRSVCIAEASSDYCDIQVNGCENHIKKVVKKSNSRILLHSFLSQLCSDFRNIIKGKKGKGKVVPVL
jgi:hypothetical protein